MKIIREKLFFAKDKILLATILFGAGVIYGGNLCSCVIVGPGSPVNSGYTSCDYNYVQLSSRINDRLMLQKFEFIISIDIIHICIT